MGDLDMSIRIPKYDLQSDSITEFALYVEMTNDPDVHFYNGVLPLMQKHLGLEQDNTEEPNSREAILACHHFIKFNNARQSLNAMAGIGNWSGFIKEWDKLVNYSKKPNLGRATYKLIEKIKAGGDQ